MKHNQSKHKNESQKVWKEKYKDKVKWQPKRTRPQNAEEKENFAPHKKFNATRQGHGSQLGVEIQQEDSAPTPSALSTWLHLAPGCIKHPN